MDRFVLTGRCRICTSEHSQEITRQIAEGRRYDDIISAFKELRLNKPVISTHKKHFVVNPTISPEQLAAVSDHGLLDLVRQLAVMYLHKGLSGAALSMTETRIIHTSVSGILGRKSIEDSQEQTKAFNRLIEEAAKRKWRYEE